MNRLIFELMGSGIMDILDRGLHIEEIESFEKFLREIFGKKVWNLIEVISDFLCKSTRFDAVHLRIDGENSARVVELGELSAFATGHDIRVRKSNFAIFESRLTNDDISLILEDFGCEIA